MSRWRKLIGVLLVGSVGLAVVGGIASVFLAGSGYLPFFSMTVVWETPVDRKAAEHGNGDWLVGDTVVRSRFDAVTAFDAGSGKKRWEYVVPRRADICAVSTVADGSVALIAYGEAGAAGSTEVEKGKGCATVAAIDLTDGREMWHTPRAPATGDVTAEPDLVATGGGLAVLRDSDGSRQVREREKASGRSGVHAVRAFDLRTGTPRWKAAVPKGCLPHRVAAAAKQVLAVVGCADELKLTAFAPADGKERWTVPLGARRAVTSADVTFLSAEPAVLRVAEGERGVNAFLAFGQDGRPQGQIDATGDYGKIPLDKPNKVAVDDGKLFAAAEYEDNVNLDRLVAFDLASGDEAWRAEGPGGSYDVAALHVEDGRMTVLTSSPKYGDGLMVFDAATGDEEDDRAFREDPVSGYDELADVLTYKDLVIAVRWGEGVRPFSAYERW
ncbi:PQQ-binding-like beta-propeller repeat protein [Streptomyces sp. NPDC049597]|uniref:outer membrane protein assembly factor BamB family protein n=1 Tax=Streptomyces sp. NPDC049597 TaxID=3155276 RepID=UPI00342AE273